MSDQPRPHGNLYPDYGDEKVPVDNSNDEHESQSVNLSPPEEDEE